MTKKVILGLLVLAAAFAFATATIQRTLSLTMGGRPVGQAFQIDGEFYLPYPVLSREFGVIANVSGDTVSLTQGRVGGIPQATDWRNLRGVQGCLNQTLPNGIFNFRVTGLEARTSERVWRATVSITSSSSSSGPSLNFLASSGFDADQGMALVWDDGAVEVTNPVARFSSSTYLDRSFTVDFFMGSRLDPARRPHLLVMLFDPARKTTPDRQGRYSTAFPSFKVDLGCGP